MGFRPEQRHKPHGCWRFPVPGRNSVPEQPRNKLQFVLLFCFSWGCLGITATLLLLETHPNITNILVQQKCQGGGWNFNWRERKSKINHGMKLFHPTGSCAALTGLDSQSFLFPALTHWATTVSPALRAESNRFTLYISFK